MATVIVVGVSHRTAPVAVRERLAVPPFRLPETLRALQRFPNVTGAVLLSTCNRVECYAASSDPGATIDALLDDWAGRAGLSPAALRGRGYQLTGEAAVRHLIRVTAGLDSMVLGESEIAAQVKQAYRVAQEAGAADPTLHRVFQQAFHAAKAIRTETGIGHGSASIGSVAVELAQAVFRDRLRSCELLLWGAGKAAEITARHLLAQGIGQLWIVNRTADRAQALATLCRGMWLSWEEALRHLDHVDIAVVCTQAPHYVIDAADLEVAMPRRPGRPLCLIDLSVPRNIDPAVKRIPSVHLYNIDDLQSLAADGMAQRRLALAHGESLLREHAAGFQRRQEIVIHQEATTCGV